METNSTIYLAYDMEKLVRDARRILESLSGDSDPHHTTCCRLAEKYNLYSDDHFPMWLCWVVTGVMNG